MWHVGYRDLAVGSVLGDWLVGAATARGLVCAVQLRAGLSVPQLRAGLCVRIVSDRVDDPRCIAEATVGVHYRLMVSD